MITTEILAIVAAAVAAFVIGMLWYHPKAFGAAWMRYANLSPEQVALRSRNPLFMILGFIGAIVVAFVLSMQLFAEADLVLALARAFWLWLGFIAPVLLGVVLWEGKAWKLYFINVGYWLVSVLTMTVVLTLL